MLEWNQKITMLFTGTLAIVFIVIGVGILIKVILPGPQLGNGMRFIFGGIILIYGLIRAIMIYRKWRKQKRSISTITIDEDRHNQ
jgi:cytochrome c biogenesis protein CcdA